MPWQRLAPSIALGISLACSGSRHALPEVSWKSPPAGPPGAEARSADQAEPKLEPLPVSPPPAGAKDDPLDHAAELSRQAAERRAAGDLTGALELQNQALAIREGALGPNHLDVAATLNSVALLYGALGNYGAAEPLAVRALSIRERALGANDRATAESLNNLALLYAAAGRFAEAELLYQRALSIFESKNDPAALATALENYAALLDDTGRTAEADAAEQRAQSLRAQHGGAK